MSDFDADSDALGLAASFPHARARAQREARQRHERGLRHFSYLLLIEMGGRKTSWSTPFGRACRPSSVTSSRGTRQAAPELLFLTVGRGKPPAPPAHFSTCRVSCFFASSCAAALLGSLIHQALPSLTIPNACLLLVLASASKKPSLFSLTATWFDFPPLSRSVFCSLSSYSCSSMCAKDMLCEGGMRARPHRCGGGTAASAAEKI